MLSTWLFTEVWSQRHEIIIAMMYNLPRTGWTAKYWPPSINELNIANHFCMVTIIGQTKPWGSFKTRTTFFKKFMEQGPSASRGQIELRDLAVCCISNKHFRPGGMALSEWRRSVRAVRDTPVADYSAPGANTTRHVAYRPPIVLPPFLLALSVSYCKWTPWRCGQLWPYVGMGSLDTSAKCKSVRKPHAVFHKQKAFRLSYSSLLQSQDSLPHNMACII